MSPRRALLPRRRECRRAPFRSGGRAAACLFKRDRAAPTSAARSPPRRRRPVRPASATALDLARRGCGGCREAPGVVPKPHGRTAPPRGAACLARAVFGAISGMGIAAAVCGESCRRSRCVISTRFDPKRTFAPLRPKVTATVDLEIRSFVRSRAPLLRRRSAIHCAGRMRDADPGSCKRSHSAFLRAPS
jgi:hypothetical protein